MPALLGPPSFSIQVKRHPISPWRQRGGALARRKEPDPAAFLDWAAWVFLSRERGLTGDELRWHTHGEEELPDIPENAFVGLITRSPQKAILQGVMRNPLRVGYWWA